VRLCSLHAPGLSELERSLLSPPLTHFISSLEKLYCKPRNSWLVAVIQGPAALSKAQMRSSFACSVVGNFLVFFVVIAFFVWFEAGKAAIGVAVAVLALISIPTFISTLRMYNMTKDIVGLKKNSVDPSQGQGKDRDAEKAGETKDEASTGASELGLAGVDDSEGVFQVCETYRITQASGVFCWIMFLAEILLLYGWPLVALYIMNDSAIATVYIFVGLCSLLRYFLNVAVVLEEVGNMRYLRGKDKHKVSILLIDFVCCRNES